MSVGSSLQQLLWRTRVRLSRVLLFIAWRFLRKSQRHIVLRDLTIETEDGPVKLGLVVVSTRGVFVAETWNADSSVREGHASWFERGCNTVSACHKLMHYSEDRARLVARVLEEEDGRVVKPVVVLTGPCALPEERPSNVVSEFGLVLYIHSFKADVYSNHEFYDIESRLRRPQLLPRRLDAA